MKHRGRNVVLPLDDETWEWFGEYFNESLGDLWFGYYADRKEPRHCIYGVTNECDIYTDLDPDMLECVVDKAIPGIDSGGTGAK